MTEQTSNQVFSRRRYLTTIVGAVAATAGCSGDSGQSAETDGEPTSTGTSTGSDIATEGPPAPDGTRNTGPVMGIERAYSIPNTTPIATDGDRVLTSTLVDGGTGFAAYNYLTGEQVWARAIDSYDSPAINVRGVQVGYERLYSIGQGSGDTKYVNVIDATTGELVGTHEYESPNNSSLLVPLDGGAFVASGLNREYTAFYVDGETADRAPSFEQPLENYQRFHRLADGGIYARGREYRYGRTEPVYTLEAPVLGQAPSKGVPHPSSESTLFGQRRRDSGTARAASREDGSILWERSDNFYVPPYGYGGETVVYLGADEGGRIIGVEPENGDIRWERSSLSLPWEAANQNVTTPFAVSERALIVGLRDSCQLLSLDDGSTLAETGEGPFSPLVVTQSRLITTGSITAGSEDTDGMIVYEY